MFKSSKKDEETYTCTLSPQLQEKAAKELKEDPKTRLLEVKNLKTRLEKVPGLQPRTDVKFLLRFLRARKFDQERTFQLVKSYYDVRLQFPDMCNDLKPSRVRGIFDDGFIEVLKHRDNEGCRVAILRAARWDPDRRPIADVMKAIYILLAKMAEEEETHVTGVHLISNLTDLTLKQLTHFTPSMAKFFINTIQDVLPLRLKRYDFVHEGSLFDVIFVLIKPFMKEKLLSRLVLNGDKYDKIHASISPEYLPADIGGKLPNYSNTEFMDDLLASDAQFEEDNKFGFVKMNVDSGKAVSRSGDAGMQGLGGTFKKLEI